MPDTARHLAEIEEQLSLRAGTKIVLQFNPHLAPMRRGIITTITVPAAPGATIDSLYAAWRAAYAGRPFFARGCTACEHDRGLLSGPFGAAGRPRGGPGFRSDLPGRSFEFG